MWTECLFHWDTSENAPNPCPSLLPPQLPRRLHWFKLIVTYFHQTSSAECKFIPYPHFITDSLIQLPASLPPPPLPRQPIHPLLPKHHISKAHNYRAPAEVQKKKNQKQRYRQIPFLTWMGSRSFIARARRSGGASRGLCVQVSRLESICSRNKEQNFSPRPVFAVRWNTKSKPPLYSSVFPRVQLMINRS